MEEKELNTEKIELIKKEYFTLPKNVRKYFIQLLQLEEAMIEYRETKNND